MEIKEHPAHLLGQKFLFEARAIEVATSATESKVKLMPCGLPLMAELSWDAPVVDGKPKGSVCNSSDFVKISGDSRKIKFEFTDGLHTCSQTLSANGARELAKRLLLIADLADEKP